MKKMISALVVAGALLTLTGTASAHVTVWPKETTTSAYEKYTVRVPVEKDVNTTKVRLEFPANVKVSTVKPVPGWTYELEKDAEGRAKAVVWTAANGGIKQGEFMEFDFVGANPKEVGEGSLTWKASQTYADGSVVDWSGAKDSKTPASVTTLKQAAAGDSHGHGDEAAKEENKATEEAAHSEAGTAPEERPFTETTLPLILSGAALLLALASLFRKKA